MYIDYFQYNFPQTKTVLVVHGLYIYRGFLVAEQLHQLIHALHEQIITVRPLFLRGPLHCYCSLHYALYSNLVGLLVAISLGEPLQCVR